MNFFAWRLKALDEMKVDSAEIEKTLKSLAATPHRLRSLTDDLDKTPLHFRSEEDPWSANDILAHLRACADVWGKSIMAMISQEHPTLRYVSPRTWMRKRIILNRKKSEPENRWKPATKPAPLWLAHVQ